MYLLLRKWRILSLLVPCLAVNVAQAATQEDTAALIVGGYVYDDDGEFTSDNAKVEIFGCPGRDRDSYFIEDYPSSIVLPEGAYFDGSVISCGGMSCGEESCEGITRECFSLGPDGHWQAHSNLSRTVFSFTMVTAVDLDAVPPSEDLTLLTVGPEFSDTSIFNPADNSWRDYRPLPVSNATWFGSRCVTQMGSAIYSVEERVLRVDTSTWVLEDLGEVPADLVSQERCSAVHIEGRPGILLKNGFWLDIERLQWEQRAYPPDSDFLVQSPNSAFSFQGRMTIFGNPFCNSEGSCEYRDVVQYDASSDVWRSIGQTEISRTDFDVVEIPITWCDSLLGPPASRPNPSDTTTPNAVSTDPPLPGEINNYVAMIIGGVREDQNRDSILPSAELFGCPGYPGKSLLIEDYPYSIYSTSGIYLEDEDKVVVCGGMKCNDTSGLGCTITDECFQYTPSNGWESFPELQRIKWSYLMVNIPNIDIDDGERYMTAVGYDLSTQMFNPTTQTWEPYINMPESNWRSTECLVQYGDYIFHNRQYMTRLDTTTWKTVQWDLPNFLQVSKTCAIVRINGVAGIMLGNGYFFNLQTETWEALMFPPYPTFEKDPDAVFGYRGMPTIFGNPSCEADGFCEYKDIIQYNNEDNAWFNLGEMVHPRRYHTVIEVPQSFCEMNQPTTPSTYSSAIIIGGSRDQVEGDGEALSAVEIFGCPQAYDSSILLDDFPSKIRGAAGIYHDWEEHLLVCGGLPCDEGEECQPTNECFQWTPEDGWLPAQEGNAVNPRSDAELFLAVDHTSTSSARTPILIGGSGLPTNGSQMDLMTEIYHREYTEYDPDSMWSEYYALAIPGWSSEGCLTAYYDDVFAVAGERLYRLHTLTWTLEDLGPLPSEIKDRQTCSPFLVGGELAGIMLRNGYWYNLEASKWETVKFPPNNVFEKETGDMFFFRGRPTIVGSEDCGVKWGRLDCSHSEVNQFDGTKWRRLGSLAGSRSSFEAVEVPNAICDRIEAAGRFTTTEHPQSTEEASTEAPITDEFVEPNTETAAMVIGGAWTDATTTEVMPSAELFGCPGFEDRSIPLQDLPRGLYLSGATFFQADDDDVGKVIVCGGLTCEDPLEGSSFCSFGDYCYEWAPQVGDWQPAPSLLRSHWNFVMPQVKNLDNTMLVGNESVVVDEYVPITLSAYKPEIYNATTSEWMPYRDMEVTESWYSSNCFVQTGDMLYYIGNDFYEFDSVAWNVTRKFDLPNFLRHPGMCSLVRVNDVQGILLTNGFWLNLRTEEWGQLRLPPFPEVLDFSLISQMMTSFQGIPTIFNAPTCDENAECEFNSVLQYDGFFDEWYSIGSLLHPNIFASVVEVPNSFCEAAMRREPAATNTVAIIVGGLSDQENEDGFHDPLQSVELFGCPDSPSLPLPDFPMPIYLNDGVNFVLNDDDVYGTVMVCGGYNRSAVVDTCWELELETMTWIEAEYVLQEPRWAHLMELVPDLDSGSNKRVPMVFGGNIVSSETFNPLHDTWNTYRMPPISDGEYWTSPECTVVHNDVVYHINDTALSSINLLYNERRDLAEVPRMTRSPGRCQIATIDGADGIMLQNGFWYNLNSGEWEAKRIPPNSPDSIVEEANALYAFRGSATVFGSPVCGGEDGLCEHREVLWYDAQHDVYVSLGTMLRGRTDHAVVEVPDSFCGLVQSLAPPPPLEVDTEAVALIVGGFWNSAVGSIAYSSAELFGCEDSMDAETGEYVGKLIDDFPTAAYLSGGVYFERPEDAQGDGQAVVCGGYFCPENTVSCYSSNECFAWNPQNQWQQFDSDLDSPRWAHLMISAQNLDSGSGDEVPMAIAGTSSSTEAFNPESGEWEAYRYLNYSSSWVSLDCLVQVGDRVYHIADGYDNKIFELDLTTWELRQIGTLPDWLRYVGTCGMSIVDGKQGIMTTFGFWYDLADDSWHQRRFPPYMEDQATPNAMTTFRGKATQFGSPMCEADGTCEYVAVYAYDGDEDMWNYLGRMVQTRMLHTVLQVPKSFCDIPSSPAPERDSAALIIGGMGGFEDNGSREIHNSVELFGCSGDQSIEFPDFPKDGYLLGGNYFDSLGSNSDGSVLVCGGFTCSPDSNVDCRVSDECYEWSNPADGWVLSDAETTRSRWAHLMASVVDLNSGSNGRAPLIIGLDDETEILRSRWESYYDLDIAVGNNWNSIGCLIQHGDTIYHMQDEVFALDTLTWEMEVVAEVPEILEKHMSRCSISVIEGKTGILIQNGFWFNLETRVWEARRFPPYVNRNIASEPNALYNFRGRPTMFGSPLCDGVGDCEYKEILQYNEVSDTWDRLGEMLQNRVCQEVIQVPGEICDFFVQPQLIEKRQQNNPEKEDEIETVAMVIGGLKNDSDQYEVLTSVELFGCPDSPTSSKLLQDYPESVVMSGGTLYDGKVVSCGGESHEGDVYSATNKCYQWTPEGQWEPFVDDLSASKHSHIMANVIDLQSGDNETIVPLVVGQNSITEIWDPLSDSWKQYLDIGSFNTWLASSCFFQEGDYIYHMGSSIERLDTTTWTLSHFGIMPDFMSESGKCAYQESAEGTPGVLFGNGYWYNLDNGTWTQLRFPPYANVAAEPNAVWSFRGKPTVFGNTVCEGDGTCIYTGVEQFDLVSNKWVNIGELNQSRTVHNVIEVPVSFCNVDEDFSD